MAHRLVNGMSSGKEAEFSMVEKMRLKLEFQYVSKLNRMLKDVAVSKELADKFNHFLAQKHLSLPLVFDIQVFASVNFPSSNFTNLQLPTLLQKCVEIFEQFHNTTYPKRKLHWLHNSHSRGEILSNCFKKPYCFKATTLQMTVLLLFNSLDTYSIGELAELTKLGINSLLQVLESLIKAKILITGNGEKAVDLTNDSVISLVKEYDNGRLHVNIASPTK
ncbi:unnamed protein product [Orchesella dallaii]|uniref:Cullin family profile domain-containing protein n=1 Tax=Orchesella dallaii TaxID=48710 RepID=A0ABP1R3Q9_9HEXA